MKINPVSNIVQLTVISALSREEFMTGQAEDGPSQFILTIHFISNVKMDVQDPFWSFITQLLLLEIIFHVTCIPHVVMSNGSFSCTWV